MDINELKLFLHLSKTLHFGKSSHELNVSPSALSRTIQRLEAELGHTLFIRDNRSVCITESGTKFREYARNAIDQWENLQENLTVGAKELKGELSLYSSVTAAYSIIPNILNKFRLHYPKVHLKLKTGDADSAIKYIMNDEVDISIAAKPDKLSDMLLFKTLVETPLVFVYINSDEESNLGNLHSKIDWAKVPMIVPYKGLARERINKWFQKKGVPINTFAEVSGNEAIISMVRLGCGVGIVPKLVLDNNPLKEYLTILKTTPPLKHYSVGVCLFKKRLKSPLIKAFWDLVNQSSSNTL